MSSTLIALLYFSLIPFGFIMLYWFYIKFAKGEKTE